MIEAFGSWLLRQSGRGDWIGGLADQALRDPAFPRSAAPDAVRTHLAKRDADGDTFEALEDAEAAWLRAAS